MPPPADRPGAARRPEYSQSLGPSGPRAPSLAGAGAARPSADKDSLRKATDHALQPGAVAHYECNPAGTAEDQQRAVSEMLAPLRSPRMRFEIVALMSRLHAGGFRPGEAFLAGEPENEVAPVLVRIGAPGRIGYIRIQVTRA